MMNLKKLQSQTEINRTFLKTENLCLALFGSVVIIFIFGQFFAAFAQEKDAALEVLCRVLPEYQQGQGVEHVPGAENVVPADLNPLKAAVPDVINIPITVRLAERFQNLNISPDLRLEPDVGLLSIHQNGRVGYNGQDISGRAYALCGKEKTLNGQSGNDPVESEPKIIEIKEGIEGEILEVQNP